MKPSGLKAAVLSAVATAALVGCSSMMKGNPSTSEAMRVDQSVPSAQGTVTAEETDNGNTHVDVKVQHLAKPGALKDHPNVYVVWAKDPSQHTPVKLGALKVDDNLKGELETVTPMRQFDLFITPEDTVAVNNPQGKQLLTAYVNMD